MGSPVEGGDVLLTRAVQKGGVLTGLLMEKVKVSFPTEGLQHSKAKTPHCSSSSCFPRRVRCNSGQYTQVQLCLQFGKAPSEPIEPF